jgi:hypothetical protein
METSQSWNMATAKMQTEKNIEAESAFNTV